MIKRWIAALAAVFAALFAAAAFAAVDANKATQAELESVKGIGPVISASILAERKKGAFKDWPDFVDRVKGVGEASATKFSEGGLVVNGKGYAGAPAKKEPGTVAKSASSAKAGMVKTGEGFKQTGKDIAGAAKEETQAFKDNARDAKAKMTKTPASAPTK